MDWIAIAFICVLVILIVVFKVFKRSQRKDGEKGRRKPTVATYPIRIPRRNEEIPQLLKPEDTEDNDERTKRERVSRKAASYGRGKVTRTYVRYDWQKRYEESIRTLFPDEWSPALPYLYEANRLEREGANQEKIQEVLDQARKADSNATSFYVARWSIIKKTQDQKRE
jgi:hypothetical protein